MRRLIVPAVFLFLVAVIAVAPMSTGSLSAAPPVAPTFNKDVLPILQKNCQECHRPGAIAPMSFMTFRDTRPYARAIAKAVVNRTMPPWFADPSVGHFENSKVLSEAGNRDDYGVGRERRAGRRRERQAGACGFHEGLDDRQARHRRLDAERHRDSARRASSISPTCWSTPISRKTCGCSAAEVRPGNATRRPSYEGVDSPSGLDVDEGRTGRRDVQPAARRRRV